MRPAAHDKLTRTPALLERATRLTRERVPGDSEDPSIPLIGVLPWEALSERGPISRSKAGGIYRYNIRPDSVRSAACQSVSLGLNQEVRLEANHTHLLFTEHLRVSENAKSR